MSRVACEAIKSQWELLGLEVQLVELPLGVTFPSREENIADIAYVSAAVWEPVIDARRVLGPRGLAGQHRSIGRTWIEAYRRSQELEAGARPLA